MAESHDLGIRGEELAAAYLKKSGYRILFRNWKWGKHEIDIIAEKDETVAFIEVKTRTAEFLAGVPATVPREKQKSVILAADGYIKRYRCRQGEPVRCAYHNRKRGIERDRSYRRGILSDTKII